MQSLSAPMYLKSLGFKGKKVNGDDTKIMVATLQIEPFTQEICEALIPKVRTRIFNREGNPNEDIITLDAAAHSGYLRVEFRMAEDQTRGSVKLVDAELDPKVAIRRDKETPVYSAIIKVESPYPTAKELFMLANSVNSQFWIDIVESRPKLEEEEPKSRQPRLEEEEGDE